MGRAGFLSWTSAGQYPTDGVNAESAGFPDRPEQSLADMSWQGELLDQLAARWPSGIHVEVTGSASVDSEREREGDGWSDLDLHVDLPDRPDPDRSGAQQPVDLFAGLEIWAVSETRSDGRQVIRAVFTDGRRLDLVIDHGSVAVPSAAPDNEVRLLAALAVTKLGRGDRLIGLHLTLELMRTCLVQAMLLRDRELGTTVHRFGSEHDAMADEISALLAGGGLEVSPRPNLVERTVALYARWRRELDPSYRADWNGLTQVIERGLRTYGSKLTSASGAGRRQGEAG